MTILTDPSEADVYFVVRIGHKGVLISWGVVKGLETPGNDGPLIIAAPQERSSEVAEGTGRLWDCRDRALRVNLFQPID